MRCGSSAYLGSRLAKLAPQARGHAVLEVNERMVDEQPHPAQRPHLSSGVANPEKSGPPGAGAMHTDLPTRPNADGACVVGLVRPGVPPCSATAYDSRARARICASSNARTRVWVSNFKLRRETLKYFE